LVSRPDAVLVNERRTAVEIELTLKSRARLATIVEQLSWDYDSVWYFAPERLRPALCELALLVDVCSPSAR
jgi:hypothetical protein